MKKFIGRLIMLAAIFCAISCGNTKENSLINKGEDFILDQVLSPSSTIFLSTTPSDIVEDLFTQWGVEIEEKHDIIMIEFETANAIGGKVRKSYCIFFVDGEPIDFADSENINKTNVHKYISAIKMKSSW